jgi:hypothetical protein
MRQPSPPPAPGAPSAGLPAAPFTGSPEDPRILTGLRARRDLLANQLERVGERRGQLASELSNTSFAEAAARRGLEQRLQVLDEQVVQLERDIVATDRQLAAAPPQLLAQTQEQREERERDRGPDEDDILGVAASGFGLGVLVMLAAARIRRWRRRGDRATARGDAPDPRIDRLTNAVDAIAVEVERIGEGQRFVTQLLADARPRTPEYSALPEAPPTQALPGAPR